MVDILFFGEPWVGALFIFVMRVLNQTLDTLRLLYVMRGKKTLVWIFGFMVSVIWLFLLTTVISNLDGPIYILAYTAGFATGGVVGLWAEERLAVGFTLIQIISPRRGSVMAERLRGEGFGVTEIPARGKDGMVTMLSLSVRRKEVVTVEKIVNEIDENAFVTTEDIRPIRRGFWRR
ncbi:MAG: DUF5698 domain-containing protein [Anaerolineae bacterium]|nr:DUF5698 domain-containing protein [Anaerolineae bacterium]MDK1080367.1 DUF5698 domain-containing protein [Anaerolineae bacterium]MDK1119011.1 DUF5698 domain-containing protein [Anaerolineae bacterium]